MPLKSTRGMEERMNNMPAAGLCTKFLINGNALRQGCRHEVGEGIICRGREYNNFYQVDHVN